MLTKIIIAVVCFVVGYIIARAMAASRCGDCRVEAAERLLDRGIEP